MDLAQLSQLKDFLEDRPSWAFLALSLTCNVTLFTLYIRALHARITDAQRWGHVTDRLSTMMGTAATKARKGRKPPADSEE